MHLSFFHCDRFHAQILDDRQRTPNSLGNILAWTVLSQTAYELLTF